MKTPAETIDDYLQELLAWEIDYRAVTRMEDYRKDVGGEFARLSKQTAREKLAAIAKKYLTDKALISHGEVALLGLVVSKPPQYQQVIDGVIEQKNSALVTCIPGNDGLLSRFLRYSLVLADDSWKIDLVQVSEDGTKWTRKAGL